MENDYSSVSRPAIRPRRSIGFRLVQIGLFFVLSLATVIAIFYAEENWRGYRGLKQYRAEQEAKGEVIDWQSIIPPAIPDDRNLAMTPLFQPLHDYERVGGKPEWRSDGEEAKAFKVINKGPRMPAAHEGRLIDLAGWERQLRHVSST